MHTLLVLLITALYLSLAGIASGYPGPAIAETRGKKLVLWFRAVIDLILRMSFFIIPDHFYRVTEQILHEGWFLWYPHFRGC